jgi:hypothetical protein
MDYTKIPDGASVFARKVCEEKAALYAQYKELQEELDCATDRYEHFLAECTALHAENERLVEMLLNERVRFSKQRNGGILVWYDGDPHFCSSLEEAFSYVMDLERAALEGEG